MLEHTLEELRAAHDELRTSFDSPVPPAEIPTRTDTGAAVMTAVAADRLVQLGDQLLQVPDGFEVNAEARAPARAPAREPPRRRDRLGACRGAGLCHPARGRDSDQAVGAGHRARHVLAPPRGAPRPAHRRDVHAAPGASRRVGVVRDLQLAAVGVRGARVRARLLDRRAGRARAVGGAVRRLHQRSADRRRPVHRLGSIEMGADLPSRAPSATRLRGQRPGALERAPRALPAARGAGQHPRRQLHDGRAVLPSAATPGARRDGAAARRDDAEGPAPAARGDVVARRPGAWIVPARARRSFRPSTASSSGWSSAAARCTTTSSGTSCGPTRAPSRSLGSSSSIRSRSTRSRHSSPRIRQSGRSSGRRRSRRTWGRGGRSGTGSKKPPRARRPHRACSTSAGRGGRARARGTRRSITTSRIGSCARRSAQGAS